MSEVFRVRCRCGAVEIEISGDPVAQFSCYCDINAYPASEAKVARYWNIRKYQQTIIFSLFTNCLLYTAKLFGEAF